MARDLSPSKLQSRCVYPRIRNYPREWVVNDDIWSLKFVRNLSDESEPNWIIKGECDPSDMEVRVCLKQSRVETLRTFFHEIMHAIEYSYDLEYEEGKKYGYKDMHEFIHKMEEYLVQFIFDNHEQLFDLLYGFYFDSPSRK